VVIAVNSRPAYISLIILLGNGILPAQVEPKAPDAATQQDAGTIARPSTYVLGPEDQIVIRALHAEEISDKPFRIQPDGKINLAMVGEIAVAGLTIGELEAQLVERLKQYYVDPQVTVTITDFRSQPVSVVGAVANPGVHQLQGHKTLLQILSMAGGPRPDAGPVVRIARDLRWGRVPLPNAHDDPGGQCNIAEVNLRELVESRDPRQNILIYPQDVISVPTGGLVYVIGEVKKSGGFVLGTRPSLSVLEALSLAEGLQPKAAPRKARILRATNGDQSSRREEPVNVAKILDGTVPDVLLKPADILFIPNSAIKNATLRSVEAAIQIGTGLVIWRR
jgi:polysaccharide export outer membrane protein